MPMKDVKSVRCSGNLQVELTLLPRRRWRDPDRDRNAPRRARPRLNTSPAMCFHPPSPSSTAPCSITSAWNRVRSRLHGSHTAHLTWSRQSISLSRSSTPGCVLVAQADPCDAAGRAPQDVEEEGGEEGREEEHDHAAVDDAEPVDLQVMLGVRVDRVLGQTVRHVNLRLVPRHRVPA